MRLLTTPDSVGAVPLGPWQDAIQRVAFLTRGHQERLDEPVTLTLTFFLPRPPSVPKSRLAPHTKPDLDKLVRAVLDAMTKAGIYKDDSRVVSMTVHKRYAGGWGDESLFPRPRVVVQVGRLA